jgi:hypothetical protein
MISKRLILVRLKFVLCTNGEGRAKKTLKMNRKNIDNFKDSYDTNIVKTIRIKSDISKMMAGISLTARWEALSYGRSQVPATFFEREDFHETLQTHLQRQTR